jgi:hypothetical protein
MPLRNQRPFNATIRTGLVFLILANLAKWFLHPSAGLSERFVDGALGLLFGISIGCLLLGLRRSSCGRLHDGTEVTRVNGA